MTEIIAEVLPGHPPGVLTGPNLAREIMAGDAAASVLAMDDDTIVRRLKALFRSGLFRVYTNTDVVGCEFGGVLKNVVAIAAGMGDGLGAGDNTRAAVITRGLAEITRLGIALGGRPETFAGLAGMGDLVATCTSVHSRNRFVGEQLGKGLSLDEIVRKMHMVAEGVKSVPCGDRAGGCTRRRNADRARGLSRRARRRHAAAGIQGIDPTASPATNPNPAEARDHASAHATRARQRRASCGPWRPVRRSAPA